MGSCDALWVRVRVRVRVRLCDALWVYQGHSNSVLDAKVCIMRVDMHRRSRMVETDVSVWKVRVCKVSVWKVSVRLYDTSALVTD